eukprot:5677889-Amphidinium_carterae.1
MTCNILILVHFCLCGLPNPVITKWRLPLNSLVEVGIRPAETPSKLAQLLLYDIYREAASFLELEVAQLVGQRLKGQPKRHPKDTNTTNLFPKPEIPRLIKNA